MQAIILCGGSATRLGVTTKHTPKLLLEVGNRSVLDRQCDFLEKVGVQELILATGHLHDVLQNVIGESCKGIRLLNSNHIENLSGDFVYLHAKTSCFIVRMKDALLPPNRQSVRPENRYMGTKD